MVRKVWQICVYAGMDDYHVVMDQKAVGRELLAQVLEEVGVKEQEWFGLQYKDDDNFWHWLVHDKKVLSQRVSEKNDPIVMFLKVSIVYVQVRVAIESEEILCSSKESSVFKELAEADKVEEYLTKAEMMSEYGWWHFLMTRPQDTTPARVSVGLTGLILTVDNRKFDFPFSEVDEVWASGKKLMIKYVCKNISTTTFMGPNNNFTKDFQFLANAHHHHYLHSAI
ncbi:FERM domain-containing protein 4A-like 2 [Homarus americanus]|uniref:FERM domain-containing protein 4A-like 2 n=1 Tax=Homarus americanus TaxID=6706 RepID=A0A8J5JAC4_HOMAM|nr:FERM domain-containing protein 4A-like 2 [Homarus americanus]